MKPKFSFGIISIFPTMFNTLNYGIIGKAIKKGIIEVKFWNPRDYAKDKNRRVDDRPYGGGYGMLMKVNTLRAAINNARKKFIDTYKVIYLTPQGRLLKQEKLNYIVKKYKGLILVAGRYQGIDERIIDLDIDEEWSIGDYILSGGELPVMVMIDAITRLVPGVLKENNEDSFTRRGILDFPNYTRPEEISGQKVPRVLVSGNHKAIMRWKRKKALVNTWKKRPDLLKIIFNDLKKYGM